MKTPIDKITLNFYEDTKSDKLLIEYFNEKYNKKFRGQKIKEMLYDILKNDEEFKAMKDTTKNNEVIVTDLKEEKKRQLRGLNTY